jgi:hypothetical protein
MKKLAILDESRSYRWWDKETTTYAFQTKNGDWWVMRPEKKSSQKKKIVAKKKSESTVCGNSVTLTVIGFALGVSLALNLIFLLWGN